MTEKRSIGRFRRRRSSGFAGIRNRLLGVGIFVLICGQASAFTAYVSNEKSNTISVIDADKFTVVRTIKVGQRPRGIGLTKDEKFILVAVGDDDTIQVIDTKTYEVVATLPSGPDPELFTQDPAGKILYVANENDNTVTIIDMERRVPLGEVQVGVEPEGMGLSPDGKTLVATSETRLDRSRLATTLDRKTGPAELTTRARPGHSIHMASLRHLQIVLATRLHMFMTHTISFLPRLQTRFCNLTSSITTIPMEKWRGRATRIVH